MGVNLLEQLTGAETAMKRDSDPCPWCPPGPCPCPVAEQSQAAVPVQPPLQHPPDVPPRPRAPAGGDGGALWNPRAAPLPVQLVGAALSLPLAVLGGSLRLLLRTLSVSAAVAGAVARAVLPRPVANALAGGVKEVGGGGPALGAAAAAAACPWLHLVPATATAMAPDAPPNPTPTLARRSSRHHRRPRPGARRRRRYLCPLLCHPLRRPAPSLAAVRLAGGGGARARRG